MTRIKSVSDKNLGIDSNADLDFVDNKYLPDPSDPNNFKDLFDKLKVAREANYELNGLLERVRNEVTKTQIQNSILKKENEILKQALANTGALIDFLIPQYAPFHLKEITQLSSNFVVDLAVKLGMFKQKHLVIRNTRVATRIPYKSQTSVFFSMVGVLVLIEKLREIRANPSEYRGILDLDMVEKISRVDLGWLQEEEVLFIDQKVFFTPSYFVHNKTQLWKLEVVLGSEYIKAVLPGISNKINHESIEKMFNSFENNFYYFSKVKMLFPYRPYEWVPEDFGEYVKLNALESLHRFGIDSLEEAVNKGRAEEV